MKPVLFEYAGISISSYAFFMAVGACLLLYRAARDAETFRIDRRLILLALSSAWIAGWIGARVFFVVEHRSLLEGSLWTWMTSPVFGGFSAYGGVLAGAGTAAVLASFSRLPVLQSLDASSLGGCLFGVSARVGCFMAGCCFGSPVEWGVVFPPGSPASRLYGESTAVHPSQLYESAALLLAAIVVVRLPIGRPGERFCAMMVSYSLVRLLLSPFRGDALVPHVFLGPAQWISVVVLLSVLMLWAKIRRHEWVASLP
jgi:phosphatidylglycerol:prolipoprotein diacylglycerol transferase